MKNIYTRKVWVVKGRSQPRLLSSLDLPKIIADKVIVINQGEIIEQGTHQDLLDARGFYHNLYLSQFKGQAI